MLSLNSELLQFCWEFKINNGRKSKTVQAKTNCILAKPKRLSYEQLTILMHILYNKTIKHTKNNIETKKPTKILYKI